MESRELDFFKRKISSNIVKANDGGVVLTNFIDETKQKIIEIMVSKEKNIRVIFDGGFINCEYKRCLFFPNDYDIEDFKVKVYEIVYNHKYLEPNHRMVLGTLMSLGIKRESIGDIYLKDSRLYFACTEEISPYLLENLKTLGKVSVELIEVSKSIEIIKNYIPKKVFLSSMRLDVVLANAYNLSRSESADMINEGLVSVNHVLVNNGSLQLKEDDLLSVRHKGRVKIGKISGNTRSNRIIIELLIAI